MKHQKFASSDISGFRIDIFCPDTKRYCLSLRYEAHLCIHRSQFMLVTSHMLFQIRREDLI